MAILYMIQCLHDAKYFSIKSIFKVYTEQQSGMKKLHLDENFNKKVWQNKKSNDFN